MDKEPEQQSEEKGTKFPTPQEIAEAVKHSLPQPEYQAPRMTDEQLREHLQVWEPDARYVDAFRTAIVDEEATPEDRINAFNVMRDKMVNQAVRGAELLIEEKLRAFQQQVAPATQYAQQAQAEQAWNDFASAYPDLKDHHELVDMVSTNLMTAGYRPKTKDELYQKVAEGTVGLIQKFNPDFSLKGGGQQQTKAPKAPAQMPQMAGAGGTPQGGPGAPQEIGSDGVADLWG